MAQGFFAAQGLQVSSFFSREQVFFTAQGFFAAHGFFTLCPANALQRLTASQSASASLGAKTVPDTTIPRPNIKGRTVVESNLILSDFILAFPSW